MNTNPEPLPSECIRHKWITGRSDLDLSYWAFCEVCRVGAYSEDSEFHAVIKAAYWALQQKNDSGIVEPF